MPYKVCSPQSCRHEFRSAQLGIAIGQQKKQIATVASVEIAESQAALQIHKCQEYESALIVQTGSNPQDFCVNVPPHVSPDGKLR